MSTAILGNGFGKVATHQPRLDCAEGDFAQTACVAVLAQQLPDLSNRAEIVALEGWTASGWSTVDTITTVPSTHMFAPDIAISPDGGEVFITQVAQTNNATAIWHVDLDTGAMTILGLGYNSVVAPRVSWNTDIFPAGVVIVGLRVAAAGEAPRWVAHRAHWTGSNIALNSINFSTLDDSGSEGAVRFVAADFDFDCEFTPTGVENCVLVAPLIDISDPTHQIGRLSSRRFNLGKTGGVTMDVNWTHGLNQGATAVIGVALAPGPMLAVSQGRTFNNGDTHNTRTTEYSGYTVAGAGTTSFTHKSDAITCANYTFNGVSTGAATPHGGVPVAWCPFPWCSSGRVVSLHFGFGTEAIPPADNFCF